MFRICFFWLFWPLVSFGQISFEDADLESYPKLDIVFNYRNPSGIDTNEVKFFENGKRIEKYQLTPLKADTTKSRSKKILVLIENSYWPRFDQQRLQVKNIWNAIADSVFGEGDLFYLATFDWTKDNKCLIFSNDKGYTNAKDFKNALAAIEQPIRDGRQHQSTEIYAALREGISFLAQRKSDSITCQGLLLFSSEFNNVFNNTQTKSDVIYEARNTNVPIYCFRYPHSDKYNLIDVSSATYGKHLDMSRSHDSTVQQVINGIPGDYAGIDYQLSYTSVLSANGDARSIEVALSSQDKFDFTFMAPSRFNVLMKKTSFKLGIIFTILLLAFGLFWLYQFQKKQKQKQQQELINIQQETKQAIENNEQKILAQKNAERIAQTKEKDAEFIVQLKQTFRALPRVPRLIDQNGKEHEVSDIAFTIGRHSSNLLTIELPSVSKSHAGIFFNHLSGTSIATNDRNFYLIDFESTNGTLLNGLPAVKSHELPHFDYKDLQPLRNNDLIQIGEMSFTFLL